MRKQELHPHTAIMNTKQKNRAKVSRQHALQWLVKKFPNAFDSRIQIQPLKIGIMADILVFAEDALAEGISKSKLREAVVIFTRRIDYLTCIKARGMRVDLYGNPTSEVSEEDAEKAGIKIKKRIEKNVKNTRKTTTTVKPAVVSRKLPQSNYSEMPSYMDKSPAYAMTQTSEAPRHTSVMVTHKPSRQYDPSAVARLKEKLGLSRTAHDKKETVE